MFNTCALNERMEQVAGRNPDISIIIISKGSESLFTLLEELRRQKCSFLYEVLVIANGEVGRERVLSYGARVISAPEGRGIPYYRNIGLKEAAGRVVAMIDDDEVPEHDRWLEMLTVSILSGEEKVTVSETHIPEGQGYLADLISSLGFPGGGSLGWRKIWTVDENGYTDRFATGNGAVERDLALSVGFEEALKHGAEDILFGERLIEMGERIKFVEEARVIHSPRKRISEFILWQVRRGRSVYELRKIRPLRSFSRDHVGGRIKRTLFILRNAEGHKKLPILFLLALEFASQFVGYVYAWLVDRGRSGREGLCDSYQKGKILS